MNRTRHIRDILAGLFALALIATVTPAYAQQGGLTGKVVDEQGAPVPDADVALDYAGEMNYHFTAKTNAKGEWARGGLTSVGRWTITVKKGDLLGRAANISVPLGGSSAVPDIVVRKGQPSSGGAAAGGNAPKVDPAAAKKNTAVVALFKEVDPMVTLKDYDGAIAKLTAATTTIENCAPCYVGIGEVYLKKNTDAQEKTGHEAETAFKKAIELDPNLGDAYLDLANLYYTQSRMDEAKPAFQKAIALNPRATEARFLYAMTLVNVNDMAGAKAALQDYLQNAPTGANAEMAKGILDSMK